MYNRCLSCSHRLGRNIALERLPTGRAIVFDSRKGRLWIICRRCRNWNLVPLEARWEAVEEAEDRFRCLKIEASTDNIALGRWIDGSELIRIGGAPLAEIALWRYTRRIASRYRTNIVAGGAVAAGAAIVSGMTGLGFPLTALAATGVFAGGLTLHDLKPALRLPGGRTLRNWHAQWVQLRPNENVHGWSLRVPGLRREIELEGQDALRALRRLLPRTNMFGAEPVDTRAAAGRVARKGASDLFLQSVASRLGQEWYVDPRHSPISMGAWGRARPYRIATAVPILRLSLEMAVNELCEARLLEGDMVQLEREWAEAEELAAISDDLLIPERVRDWVRGRSLGAPPHPGGESNHREAP